MQEALFNVTGWSKSITKNFSFHCTARVLEKFSVVAVMR